MTTDNNKNIWPNVDTTRIPYRLIHDDDIYQQEQARIFQGPAWHYLCLSVEVPEAGCFITSFIGETPIIVSCDDKGELHGLINRCKHKGALVAVESSGRASTLRCLYHGWSYHLNGDLRMVPFEKGIEGKGGMPPGFNKAEHGLTRIQIQSYAGVVFGTLGTDVENLETYLGPDMRAQFNRVFHKPVVVLGYYHQVMHSNWKLYMENARDAYHATILHAFYASFKLNRLTMGGGLVVNHSGWNTMNYSIGASVQDGYYNTNELRSVMADVGLADPTLLNHRLEFSDGITIAIQSIFPTCVHQQIYNTLAMRQVVPLGLNKTELHWTFFGYADDDPQLRQLRLQQANLIGPAGYVSMEDGVIGDYVQRGTAGEGVNKSAMLQMGGSSVESVTDSRANETTVRGFWQGYRTLMGQ